MKRRQLISSEDALQAKRQHKTPCTDCPWARTALPGWLGSTPVDEWISDAHGEAKIDCHVFQGAQCAGVAIYRANMCKTPRYPDIMRLPADTKKVFATPVEFVEHHKDKKSWRKKA